MIAMLSIYSDSMVLQRRKGIMFFGYSDEPCAVTVSMTEDSSGNVVRSCSAHAVKRSGRDWELGEKRAGFDHFEYAWQLELLPLEAGGPYTVRVSADVSSSGDGQQGAPAVTGRVSADGTLVFRDVMVGEVYIAGGQSNMEMELQNVDGGKEALKTAEADGKHIRYFYTPKIAYICPQLFEAEKNNGWQTSSSPNVGTWSAAAWFFARKLSTEIAVNTYAAGGNENGAVCASSGAPIPIGIIGCNWGGSYACNWFDRDTLSLRKDAAVYIEEYEQKQIWKSEEEYLKDVAEYNDYHNAWVKKADTYTAAHPDCRWADVIAHVGENKWPGPMGPRHQFRPGGLYESMIMRVAPYTIGGALYYQGESDDKKPYLYRTLIGMLIEKWRYLWRDPELPFLIVQLAPWNSEEDTSGRKWAVIRQAQLDVFKTYKRTGLAVITDSGDKKDIHPKDKKTVGERLAMQAMLNIYGGNDAGEAGIRAALSGPVFKAAVCSGDEAVVSFYYAEDGLELCPTVENQFEVCGPDGVFVHAQAAVVYDDISHSYVLAVSAPGMDDIKAVRYAYKNWCETGLRGRYGLPASPFTSEPSAV